MDLPAPVKAFLEGPIDHYSQARVEAYANFYLAGLVAIAFAASYATASVLVALEIFGGGFLVLLVACVPAWPFLNKHKARFLPVRSQAKKAQ